VQIDGPDYSIVVPAYNEEALLPATLTSLRTAMDRVTLRGELVVVDNNSTDRTAHIARSNGARVVAETVNHIARARNAGARASRGRFLVFVDADTVVPAAVLEAALESLGGGEAVGGGSVVSIDFGTNRVAEALLRFWNRISVRGRLAAGSFLFCRRDAFIEVGGFSEAVYASEELWLSRALRRWGEPRGLSFVILDGPPVQSSGRKGEWYGATTLVGVTLLFTLFPFLVRSKRFCWLWYRRPAPPSA
jgi:glycosyltransferase involved in cell wall biosynthesis